MDTDFLFGSKQAFESAMMAIFHSKKIRAGEVILREVEDESEGNKENKENKENKKNKEIVDNKDEITEKMELKKDDAEPVKELNDDAPFAPDLSGESNSRLVSLSLLYYYNVFLFFSSFHSFFLFLFMSFFLFLFIPVFYIPLCPV